MGGSGGGAFLKTKGARGPLGGGGGFLGRDRVRWRGSCDWVRRWY